MPVVGQSFPEQHEVARAESGDVIPDAAGALTLSEKGQFHFEVVVPVCAFARDADEGVRCGDGIDLAERLAPRDQTEGVAAWELDDFFGASHGGWTGVKFGKNREEQRETIVAGVETGSVEVRSTGGVDFGT